MNCKVTLIVELMLSLCRLSGGVSEKREMRVKTAREGRWWQKEWEEIALL